MKLKRRWHGPCVYKVREVKAPYSGESRSLRIVVAVPNMEGHRPFKNEPCVSFRKGFLLFESSDFRDSEVSTMVSKVTNALKGIGFETVEEVESYEARMTILMTPSKTMHKEQEESV